MTPGVIAGAFAVFALGLRHGADPDHLAAIDNVTRNAFGRSPKTSRFVGTLFAGGHSLMVLAIAALVGYLGTKITAHGTLIEAIGTWISIVVLLLIAALNIRQLRLHGGTRIAGAKTRLLPKRMREATNPFIAVPIGFLFGFGFETSSQIATYTVAFSLERGVVGALLIGAMFCFGMICTDTLDSLLVHRLISYRSDRLPAVMRMWLWSVTLLAIGVAGYEAAQFFGYQAPIGDLGVSAVLVAILVAVFTYIFIATAAPRSDAGSPAVAEASPTSASALTPPEDTI